MAAITTQSSFSVSVTTPSNYSTATNPLTTPEIIIYSLLSGLVVTVTVSGNILVLISLVLERQLRSISNYFLVSLAVADLMIGLVSMPLYTAFLIVGYWPLPYYVCDLWLSVDYTMSNASVANLLIISIDRYCAIRQPLTYRVQRTSKRVCVMIGVAWTISALMWTPLIYIWPIIDGKRKVPPSECYIQFIESNSLLTLLTACLAYFIPVTIISFLYYRIYRETNLRRKMMQVSKNIPRKESGDLVSRRNSSSEHKTNTTSPTDKGSNNVFDTLFRRINNYSLRMKRGISHASSSSSSTNKNHQNPNTHSATINRLRYVCNHSTNNNFNWTTRSAQTSLIIKHSDSFQGPRDHKDAPTNAQSLAQQRWDRFVKKYSLTNQIPQENLRETYDYCCNNRNFSEFKSLSDQKLRFSKSQSLNSDSSLPEPIKLQRNEEGDLVTSAYTCCTVALDDDVPEEVKVRPNRVDSPIRQISTSYNCCEKQMIIPNPSCNLHSSNSSISDLKLFNFTHATEKNNQDKDPSQSTNHHKPSLTPTTPTKQKSNQTTTPLCLSQHSSTQKSENKAAKTLSAILLAFIITWTPYNIFTVINAFYDNDSKPIGRTIYSLGYWLCYLNSTVNPVLYAFCNPLFRRTFISILTCSMSSHNHNKNTHNFNLNWRNKDRTKT